VAASGRVPSPAAQVLVTVPVFALMGLTDEPADLDGYGPIPASMARKLVADGASSFRRVLTDPRNGAPLEIGRNSYPIPAAMRQWLRLRDRKCSFPGCNNQSLDNEADHILAWTDGGNTDITNLESLCPQTPPPGHPPQPASTNHPAGPHPPAATTKANTTTGNHPNGHHKSWTNWRVTNQIRHSLKAGVLTLRCLTRRHPTMRHLTKRCPWDPWLDFRQPPERRAAR
jgi:hypothetical protein